MGLLYEKTRFINSLHASELYIATGLPLLCYFIFVYLLLGLDLKRLAVVFFRVFFNRSYIHWHQCQGRLPRLDVLWPDGSFSGRCMV